MFSITCRSLVGHHYDILKNSNSRIMTRLLQLTVLFTIFDFTLKRSSICDLRL